MSESYRAAHWSRERLISALTDTAESPVSVSREQVTTIANWIIGVTGPRLKTGQPPPVGQAHPSLPEFTAAITGIKWRRAEFIQALRAATEPPASMPLWEAELLADYIVRKADEVRDLAD